MKSHTAVAITAATFWCEDPVTKNHKDATKALKTYIAALEKHE